MPKAEPAPAQDEAITGRAEASAITPDVQFDNYTLFLKGQRVFIHSGEFHTFRLPVPSLWPDILQKAKAAGLNAISVYLHMGLTNPAPGVLDFESFRALQPLYDAAKDAGIWIVLRPGPYINAETTAGGIAHWATSEVAGRLRTNDTSWRAAWREYIQGVIDATVPNQISSGGPVIAVQIDNEYTNRYPTHAGYYQDLIDFYHASEIDVPLTYNDFGGGKSFVNGTGAVDLWGLDSYPQGFDCSNPLRWSPVVTDYHQHHQETNPWQPFYIPEFQGGSFDAWGPTAPGFDACRILTGPDFMSVFNLQLWAGNAKLINYYMFYGGTSWGGSPHPGVYTSYDYGASITESRELGAKFDELKRQGIFIRSSPEFYKTDRISDSSSGPQISSNPDVFITQLKNPDVHATFYIARHRDSTSNATADFRLNVTTSLGNLQIPRFAESITLGGRQSKVIVTDYTFGSSSLLFYATTQVFYSGVIAGRDVLLVYGDSDQDHETTIIPSGTPNRLQASSSSFFKTTEDAVNGTSTITITSLRGARSLATYYDSDTQLVMYADTQTVSSFWSPVIAGPETDPFRNYWGIGTNQSILVGGPYLLRDATLQGDTLALRGDLRSDVQLTVIGIPEGVTRLSWNGQDVSPDLRAAEEISSVGGSVFVGRVAPKASLTRLEVPQLNGWKYQDSLPEISQEFDDGAWTVANRTETNIPYKPYYGDGRVLYGCDYGFCENVVLWRGHFLATGNEQSVNLSINGGTAFAASVWLNDVFLGTSFGNSTNNRNIIQETDDNFNFPSGAVRPNEDNVITIVQDNMGLNQTDYGTYNGDTSKSPRGVRGFRLLDGTFGEWKVQGKVGGYRNFPDKVRGILNEGGLYGERQGWHLPGFSTEGWTSRNLSDGLPDGVAGVGFFVTTFNLDIPQGLDVMLSFNFEEPLGQPYRAFLFVNGWMMGKRIANLG
ncbi:hypothetical protein EST38_g7685 [Candolleomyces aberdarensis]|uniref:beta-galactosidase n=1 Tax=Candolleomyces aberdarensis TaxID=2316362 RepID=A0A4Q2DEI2_9AGAR|nr:hypothetical protein EST38_g7685 [Candolleomyces aberdarensis]